MVHDLPRDEEQSIVRIYQICIKTPSISPLKALKRPFRVLQCILFEDRLFFRWPKGTTTGVLSILDISSDKEEEIICELYSSHSVSIVNINI
jgi:hypothetical protein